MRALPNFCRLMTHRIIPAFGGKDKKKGGGNSHCYFHSVCRLEPYIPLSRNLREPGSLANLQRSCQLVVSSSRTTTSIGLRGMGRPALILWALPASSTKKVTMSSGFLVGAGAGKSAHLRRCEKLSSVPHFAQIALRRDPAS